MVMTTRCPTCGGPLDFGESSDPREARPVRMEQTVSKMDTPPLSSAVLEAARRAAEDDDDGIPQRAET